MTRMVNKDRLAKRFLSLVQIDSLSRQEALVANEIEKILHLLGADIHVDHAGIYTGGNAGNLIAKLSGNTPAQPLLISAHMDTVEPGRNIVPIFENGKFMSDGSTILGADDKSAIAVILEALEVLVERQLPFGPLELVFTVCEEIGLLGAKHLDYNLITAKMGFVLDASDPLGIIVRSPYADRFDIQVIGKATHAGAHPEKGINAITVASHALSKLTCGRIDEETTCNIGKIEGGKATNIVPDRVRISGEARSRDEAKLERLTASVIKEFETTVARFQAAFQEDLPRLETRVFRQFNGTHIPEDHPVITLAKTAGRNLGLDIQLKSTGGGSDVNVFVERGIIAGVLGTGMRDIHSIRENVALEDMIQATELLLEIISLHAKFTHY